VCVWQLMNIMSLIALGTSYGAQVFFNNIIKII